MAAKAADTIVALSSGAPPAAIAIVRVSGPGAFVAAERMTGTLPPPRRAAVRALRLAEGDVIDRALVLAFPGPETATGEDVVEFHCHGGRAVVRAVEQALVAQPGLRRAEPGEFTRRALATGRIDLAEAEGLADLLVAETEAQRRAAMASVEGAVSRKVAGWSQRLLAIAAQTEAALDFSEEGDVALDLTPVAAEARALAADVAAVLDNPPVERLHDGVRVVLAGAPNSGKSTLLNAMTEREIAIVSPISGTTRDRIEIPVVRSGIAYLLTDTAGLRERSDDPIEAIGIERAREAIGMADVVLWLDDAPPPPEAIAVHPRADEPDRRSAPAGRIAVSARTGEGMTTLWNALAARANVLLPRLDRLVLNARQRDLCQEAEHELRVAAEVSDPLLIAEHLRRARLAFDRLTGAADVEDMLDTLFGRFCIGK